MEQEKRILIRKQFEISSNKDKKNVILYLLDMGYDNKDLTEILGVNVKKIYNIKAAKLNQHYMEQIIGTKIYGLVAELVREDENQIADLAMKGYSIDDIVIRIGYSKGTVGNIAQRVIVERKLKPVAIMFSEYYFYVTAFISDEEINKDFEVLNDSFPSIYRIDRLRELKILDEKFFIPYRNRFEEGEFRKRIQFMYGGKLRNVKFKYIGDDIDAILDRLPTAQILEEGKGYYIVKAEVFGKGIDMWLRSQGDKVEVMG